MILFNFLFYPSARFLKIWVSIRITVAFLLGIVTPLRSTFFIDSYSLYNLEFFLIAITWLDMYLMFHVGYFNQKGLLMHHPAKTAPHYLKGIFELPLSVNIKIYQKNNFRKLFPRFGNNLDISKNFRSFIYNITSSKFDKSFTIL